MTGAQAAPGATASIGMWRKSMLPRLLFITVNSPDGCLSIERHCGVCDYKKLFDSARRIRVHGEQGYRKDCRCSVCERWHMKDVAQSKKRNKVTRRNNQNLIKATRRGTLP